MALIAIAACAGALVHPAAQGLPAAADLAARVQAHYNTVRDFTADFTLSSTSGLLPRATVEQGQLKVKKPGRMRWAYTSDDKKLFVADGVQVYSYFPKDKYVAVTPLPKGDQASTALLFLTGNGDVVRDFAPSVPADQPAGEWQLVLKPKAPQADFTSLVLHVDRRTMQIRGFVVSDTQGGKSTFRFENIKENQNLADRDFLFTIPKGVEVRR
ncbi:MAG: outer membrane lipoprotein chaperone LolA [Acidobacteriota bacterium]